MPHQTVASKKLTLLSNFGVTQNILEPTHRCGHILDWLTSREGSSVFVHDVRVQDSSLLITKLRSSGSRCVGLVVLNAQLRRGTWSWPTQVSSQQTRQLSFNALLQHDECYLDRSMELYSTSLKETLDKHAPLTTQHVTSRPSAPWVTEEAREARRQRRKVEKWRATRLEVHRQLFVKCRNEVKTLFRAAKKDYYCSGLTDCTAGRQLYSLTTKQESVHLTISLLVICQIRFFFFSLWQNCQKFGMKRTCNKRPDYEHFDGNSTLSRFRAVEESEVAELLKNSLNKGCLLDPLPPCLAKSHKEQLVTVITKMVNLSLVFATVPRQLIQAPVTPLLQTNKPTKKRENPWSKHLEKWQTIIKSFFSVDNSGENSFFHNFKLIWKKTIFSKPVCIPKVPQHWNCCFGCHQCSVWPSWWGTGVCAYAARSVSGIWYTRSFYSLTQAKNNFWYLRYGTQMVRFVY